MGIPKILFKCSFEEFSLAKKNFKWVPGWLAFFVKQNKSFTNISTRKITVLKKKWTLLRSPAQDKKSREQFGCFSTKTSVIFSFNLQNAVVVQKKNYFFQFFFFFLSCLYITLQLNKLPLHTFFVGKVLVYFDV